MKVLVVGGSGFIGRRLVGALEERGHQVTVFDTTPLDHERMIVGDVRDAAAVATAAQGAEAIINLAAAHRDDVRPVSLYDEVNVSGARNVVRAAELNGVRTILFTSTVAVYGLDAGNSTETDEPAPFNHYGRTKLEAEAIFGAWADSEQTRALVIVRPCVIFGEGNRGNVYTLANQVARGRFLQIGAGSNRKSMAYVGNIVEFLAMSLDATPGTTLLNYADKPDLSTHELVSLLRSALGKGGTPRVRIPLALGLAAGHTLDAVGRVTRRSFPISAVRIRKYIAETIVNTDALESTGYQRPYPLDEALRRTVLAEFPPREQQE